MVEIKLKMNVSSIFVAIHPRKELIRDFNANKFIKIDNKYGKGLDLVLYRRIITKSLSTPYETQCVDYTKRGYISRKDCIYRCRIKHMKDRSPYLWPGNYLKYGNQH